MGNPSHQIKVAWGHPISWSSPSPPTYLPPVARPPTKKLKIPGIVSVNRPSFGTLHQRPNSIFTSGTHSLELDWVTSEDKETWIAFIFSFFFFHFAQVSAVPLLRLGSVSSFQVKATKYWLSLATAAFLFLNPLCTMDFAPRSRALSMWLSVFSFNFLENSRWYLLDVLPGSPFTLWSSTKQAFTSSCFQGAGKWRVKAGTWSCKKSVTARWSIGKSY